MKGNMELYFSDNDDNEIDIIPENERILSTQAYDKSVEDLITKMRKDPAQIILNPDYQRNYVWDNKKASLLIESLLLNVPIPSIYVQQAEDGKWDVVDGQQRLKSLLRFYEGEFRLTGLEVFDDLNHKYYSQLEPRIQQMLNDKMLRVVVIFPDSNPTIKYDIFARLNRGSVKLTEQELRNCIYRGELNKLVMNLRKYKPFQKEILKLPVDGHKTMMDAELVLRFFALNDAFQYNTEIKKVEFPTYKGSMKFFINKYMENNKKISTEKLEILKELFCHAINVVYKVFGDNAFKNIKQNGFDKKLNKAIFDIQIVTFLKIDNEAKLFDKKDEITEALFNLIKNDSQFDDSVSKATGNRFKLEYRFTKWYSELERILS